VPPVAYILGCTLIIMMAGEDMTGKHEAQLVHRAVEAEMAGIKAGKVKTYTLGEMKRRYKIG